MQSIHHANMASIIAQFAHSEPDRPSLLFECGAAAPEVARSYGQLWHNGQALARGLRGRGVGRGSVIAVLMANHAEFVELMVAVSLIRAIMVPIDPRTRGEKLTFMIANTGATSLIAADYALPNVEEVMQEGIAPDWLAVLATEEGPGRALWRPGALGFDELRLDGEEVPLPTDNADDAMLLIHTSGTTGDPKAVVLTQRRFCESAAWCLQGFGYRPSDRLYSGLSLTHSNALLVTMAPALLGGLPVVFSRRFTRSRLWDVTRKYGCTSLTLLGGMTTALYAAPPCANDADNPVRFVVSAGIPAAIWENFERRFDLRIMEFYGAAEGGFAVNPIDVGPIGSIGRIAPHLAYRIVDESGTDVPCGSPGELWVRPIDGSPAQIEYYGNPEASARKGAGGWLHMGDVVREDSNGWLYFEYRQGGGLRRNGDFINTAFVEKAIAESGMVADVFVYGVPASSAAPGEKDVVAAVVPLNTHAFDAQALFDGCRGALEANFMPTYIQVVDEIPKTASEKPQERFLIEALRRRPECVFVEERLSRITAAAAA